MRAVQNTPANTHEQSVGARLGALRNGVVASLAGVILLAACGVGSRVNAENYQKIQNGMSREAVHELLGKPDEVSGTGIGELSLASEVWRGPQQTIHVSFFNDQVKLKSIGNKDDDDKKP